MLKQKEATSLFENLKHGTSNIINRNERYVLVRPKNTWDMNYELHDNKEGLTYLIDIDDVQASFYEDYEGVLYDDLMNLEIDMIIDVAWKIEEQVIQY